MGLQCCLKSHYISLIYSFSHYGSSNFSSFKPPPPLYFSLCLSPSANDLASFLFNWENKQLEEIFCRHPPSIYLPTFGHIYSPFLVIALGELFMLLSKAHLSACLPDLWLLATQEHIISAILPSCILVLFSTLDELDVVSGQFLK